MEFKSFNLRLQEGLSKSDEQTLNDFLKKAEVNQIYASLVTGPILFWSIIVFYDKKDHNAEYEAEIEPIALTPEEDIIYQKLKKWRINRAVAEGIAAYVIAHNKHLQKMVKIPAKTKEDLLRIRGFGEKRIEKYGDEILQILNASNYLE